MYERDSDLEARCNCHPLNVRLLDKHTITHNTDSGTQLPTLPEAYSVPFGLVDVLPNSSGRCDQIGYRSLSHSDSPRTRGVQKSGLEIPTLKCPQLSLPMSISQSLRSQGERQTQSQFVANELVVLCTIRDFTDVSGSKVNNPRSRRMNSSPWIHECL